MSRYRKLMSEALNEVRAFEDADYLKPRLNPQQIANIKKVFQKKKASDITQSVKDMIKKMDIPTQLAIKQADIPHLSKLVEEEFLPEFNVDQIKKLQKEYEPMRGKTISVTNANKLGAMFTKFDRDKNTLEKLYGANIPFLSTMAMTRLISKHGYTAAKLKKVNPVVRPNPMAREDFDLLEEAELFEGTGTIKGFKDNKEKSNMVSLAKQHGLKVKDVSGGIELSGNMRKILDMQLAAQGNGLKAEEVKIDEGRMSDIDAMRKAGATAAEIAKELKLPVRAVKDILGEELTEEEDAEKLKAELEDKEKEIAMLKQKAETEKAKTQKKETEKLVNPETGEPLLQVGVAYKHLKDKMEKEKAAEVRMKRKDEEEKKKAVQKFKDRIKESLNLDESDASDQAKNMGLDYMKFGRYGKDGKVTHISKGGQLVKTTGDKDVDDVNKSLAKARGDKKKDEPKQEPAPKPKIDKFDAQKDLEKEVTDGMIDVEDDGEGGLSMNKEYEPSQDYEAERDTIAIKDYLMDKGVDEDDIYIDVDTEDDYISVSVQVRGEKKETKEEVEIKEFKKMKVTIRDMDKRKKAIADLIKQNLGVSVTGGIIKVDGKGKDLNNFAKDLMNFYGANVVAEADLSKSQIKKVHKMADELPKKDFKDRYGKEKGDAVRYATATNMVKKKLGIEESAAAAEIQKNNTRRDSMDYNMYKKTVELLRKKDYKALGKHIYDAETAPREYVMGFIDKKEPQTFKKMFGNQSGYYSLMKPLKMSEQLSMKATFRNGDDKIFKGKTASDIKKQVKDYEKKHKTGLQHDGPMVKEGKNMKEHPAKAVYEQIKGLKNKAEKSGMPYSILKKVYDRGMAAWRGGHRPGTTQQQWAFARVNSFVTKSSGTWGGADKDLAAKVRGSK